MNPDNMSKSYFDLEEVISKENTKTSSEAESDAKEAGTKIKAQHFKLQKLLEKLDQDAEAKKAAG